MYDLIPIRSKLTRKRRNRRIFDSILGGENVGLTLNGQNIASCIITRMAGCRWTSVHPPVNRSRKHGAGGFISLGYNVYIVGCEEYMRCQVAMNPR